MSFWNRNYVLVVIGQIISLFANNILHFALSLYIWDLTGSGTAFGLITAISMLPTVLFMPFGGILADRVNKKRIMVGMDILTGLVILAAYIPLFGGSPIPAIAGLLIVLSIIEAFYTPCVQASIPVLQEVNNLVKGNALVNQIAMGANIIGAVLGGVLYGFVGIKAIVLGCIGFFFASAFMEAFIQIRHARPESNASGALSIIKSDFKDGWHFLMKQQRSIMKLIPTIAALNFAVASILTVVGPFIIRILLGMPDTLYGLSNGLIAAAGLLGGFIAAMMSKKFKTKSLYLILILLGVSLVPLALGFVFGGGAYLLFALTTICLMVVEICACIFSIYAVTAVELGTPTHMLGKVMAFITTISICAEPVGRAVFGKLVDITQSHIYILLLACAVFVVLFGLSTQRPLAALDRDISRATAKEKQGGEAVLE